MPRRRKHWAHRSADILRHAGEHAYLVAAQVHESHVAIERSRDLLACTAPLIGHGDNPVEMEHPVVCRMV